MKLKRKLLLSTTAIAAVVAIPVATVASCGSESNIDWNINDKINGKTKEIKLSLSQDVKFIGDDGAAQFEFKPSSAVSQELSQAKAKITYEVFYYKLNKWQTVTTSPKDLSVYDEVKVKVEVQDEYRVNGNKTFEDKIKVTLKGYNPYDPTEVVPTIPVSSANNILEIDLTNATKLNEVVYTIASEMGILLSSDITKALGTTNSFTPLDLFNSLNAAKAKGITSVKFKYKTEEEIVAITDMKPLYTQGIQYIDKYKNVAPIPEGGTVDPVVKSTFVDVSNKDALAFAGEYIGVISDRVPNLLAMIGGMFTKAEPHANPPVVGDVEALRFIPKIANEYGKIFSGLETSKLLIKWSEEIRLRPYEVGNLNKILVSTLFRFKK